MKIVVFIFCFKLFLFQNSMAASVGSVVRDPRDSSIDATLHSVQGAQGSSHEGIRPVIVHGQDDGSSSGEELSGAKDSSREENTKKKPNSVSCCKNRKSYNYCPRLCPGAYRAFGLTEAPFIPLPPLVVDPKEAAGIGELHAPWTPLPEN